MLCLIQLFTYKILQKMTQKFNTLLSFLLFAVPLVAQTSYTWTGATNTDYLVGTNWSPTRSSEQTNDILLFTGNATVTNVTNRTIGQLKLSNNATVSLQSVLGATPSTTRTLRVNDVVGQNLTGDDIDVPVGCTLIIAATGVTTEGLLLTLGNSGSATANIAGTLTIERNSATTEINRFVAVNGVTTITGTVKNGGTFGSSTTSSLIFASGSTYESLRTADVAFPTASYTDVNVNVTGLVNGSVSGCPASIKNFTWNCPSQTNFPILGTGNMQGAATTLTISGNVNMVSTNTGGFQFNLPTVSVAGDMSISAKSFEFSRAAVSTTATFTVAGNLTVSAGASASLITTNTGTVTVSVNNFTQTAGTLSLTSSTGGTSTLVVKGNFNRTGGTFQSTTTAGKVGILKFGGTTAQTYTSTSDGGTTILQLSSGVIVEMDNSSGLTLNSGMFLNTASPLKLTNGIVTVRSPAYLTLTGPLEGGSATSYVDGALQRTLTAATPFTFPVGKGGVYRLVTITPENTTSVAYRVEYVNSTYSNTTSITAPIVKINRGEYHRIARTSGTTNAKIGLDYSFSSGGVTNTAHLNIARFGTTWVKEGTTPVVAGTTSSGTITTDNFVNLPSTATFPFTIGSEDAASPLPIELTSFMAKIRGSVNQIAWTTASEKNNAQFIVERSESGQDFSAIGTVKGNGTTAEKHDYTFTDETPLSISYYRLRQIDFDGAESLSKVVSVVREKNNSGLVKIYPSVTKNFLTIDLSNNEDNAAILIADMSGKSIVRQNIRSGQQVDVAHLSSGRYIVIVETKGVRSTESFIKMR
jgi:Secretion system C-terminal sorting domain